MAAIRIIDSHLELADIGTNTHAQIDTHIAAAGNYVKRDGSLALTADWDIGDGRKMMADEIRARDAAGLKLYDDGGNGIFVEDGGDVGVGTAIPDRKLHVMGDITLQAAMDSHALTLYFDNATGDGGRAYLKHENNIGQFTIRVGYNDHIRFLMNATEAMRITLTGDVGIGTTTPSAKLDVNSDIIRLRTAKTPATAGAAGNQGDICWDADYIYVCTATNSWERAAIAAW